jgi:outer membrane protein OmpA-like peptidoglycan-associated protein
MHRHRQAFLALAGALSLVPVGQLAAAEMPALPQLIEMLRPPGERASASASAGFSTTAPTVSRARPAVDEAAARTTAPEGTAAAALALPFQSGSAALTAEAEKMLEALARALNSPELAKHRFKIEGHTDTAGDAPINMILSERRAATVREYLVSRLGVPASRLDAVGLGETQLLVQTPDATAEPRNRRVQILNIGS